MDERTLIKEAMKARGNSYAPYSLFSVGAALLCKDGTVFKGCNIENSSYGVTNCAERTALFKAVSEGYTEFEAIAIVGGEQGANPKEICPPCGVCRQALAEFCEPEDLTVILATNELDYRKMTLADLLPLHFSGESL